MKNNLIRIHLNCMGFTFNNNNNNCLAFCCALSIFCLRYKKNKHFIIKINNEMQLDSLLKKKK